MASEEDQRGDQPGDRQQRQRQHEWLLPPRNRQLLGDPLRCVTTALPAAAAPQRVDEPSQHGQCQHRESDAEIAGDQLPLQHAARSAHARQRAAATQRDRKHQDDHGQSHQGRPHR